MKPSKYFFEMEMARKISAKLIKNEPVRLLELGCGTAALAARLLERFPSIGYVGIEPEQDACIQAKQALLKYPHARLLHALGYEGGEHGLQPSSFDYCFSLSVLEHVKELPAFVSFSAQMAKEGGEVIHLYDLGHSVYPSGVKEWIQVQLCQSWFIRLVPETKVARYLSTESVERLLRFNGCEVERIGFHNMPSHVALLKAASQAMAEKIIQPVIHLEMESAAAISDIKKRERLFPSICFWTVKRHKTS